MMKLYKFDEYPHAQFFFCFANYQYRKWNRTKKTTKTIQLNQLDITDFMNELNERILLSISCFNNKNFVAVSFFSYLDSVLNFFFFVK